jgi:hypothetical protein
VVAHIHQTEVLEVTEEVILLTEVETVVVDPLEVVTEVDAALEVTEEVDPLEVVVADLVVAVVATEVEDEDPISTKTFMSEKHLT